MDHVKDYRPPKDSEDIDDVTKRLREDGCAPQHPPSSSSESEEEEYAVVVKKPKKGEETRRCVSASCRAPRSRSSALKCFTTA